MKYALFILVFISTASFGYVTLPVASEYNNSDLYYSDCVRSNGDDNTSICESATRQAFPEEMAEAEPVQQPNEVQANNQVIETSPAASALADEPAPASVNDAAQE